MKRFFDVFDRFMVRVPLASSEDFIQYTVEGAYVDRVANDNVFLEQLFLASPSLYSMIKENMFNKLSEKKKNGLCDSIYKYDMRRCFRATPFGLFSAVGLGAWSQDNNTQISTFKFKKKAQIDTEWLFKLIRNIEKDYMQNLRFAINGAYYVKGERAHLLYTTEESVKEINMRRTNALEILEKLQGYVAFDEILELLYSNYPGIDKNVLTNFLTQLVEKEVLISDIRVPLSCHNLIDDFIKRLNKYPELYSISAEMEKIEKYINKYENTLIGQGILQYSQINRIMKEIIDTKSYIQVDMKNEEEISLNIKSGGMITELASLLVALGAPTNNNSEMDMYRDRFIEKYGMNKEVPILEMLDSTMGIGAPYSYMNPRNDFMVATPENLVQQGLTEYWQYKYLDAVINDKSIEIKEEELKEYYSLEVSEAEVPTSLELCLIPKKRNGSLQFYLGNLIGASHAGKTFGRFSYLSNEFEKIVKAIDKKERELLPTGTKLCDINFLPAKTRGGNVMKNMTQKDAELTFFTSPNSSESIRVTDVVIGVNEGKFYARNMVTGDYLIFRTGNMYNYMLTNNAIRFLQEISYEGKKGWSSFPWKKIFKNMKYVPEIKYKDFVLQKRYWCIKNTDLKVGNKFSFEKFVVAINNLRKDLKMPERVCFPIADHKLIFSFESDSDLRIMYDEFKKRGADGVEIEALEEGDDIITDEKGKLHSCELVVPMYSKYKEPSIHNNLVRKTNLAKSEQIILPFSNWMYLKLYMKDTIENDVLINDINNLRIFMRDKYNVNSFFMRYLDPYPHIRLRFWGPEQLPGEVYGEIGKWLLKLQQEFLIDKCTVDTYERESERYGGAEENIKMAEEIFAGDSDVVISLLRMKEEKQLNLAIEEIGIVTILKYLEFFRFDYKDILEFLTKFYHSSEYLSEFKTKKEYYIKLFDFENKWENFMKDDCQNSIMNILWPMKKLIEIYRSLLDETTKSKEDLFDIVASVLHLHCNRLFGTDRKIEMKVMTFLEHLVYAKKHQLHLK